MADRSRLHQFLQETPSAATIDQLVKMARSFTTEGDQWTFVVDMGLSLGLATVAATDGGSSLMIELLLDYVFEELGRVPEVV